MGVLLGSSERGDLVFFGTRIGSVHKMKHLTVTYAHWAPLLHIAAAPAPRRSEPGSGSDGRKTEGVPL